MDGPAPACVHVVDVRRIIRDADRREMCVCVCVCEHQTQPRPRRLLPHEAAVMEGGREGREEREEGDGWWRSRDYPPPPTPLCERGASCDKGTDGQTEDGSGLAHTHTRTQRALQAAWTPAGRACRVLQGIVQLAGWLHGRLACWLGGWVAGAAVHRPIASSTLCMRTATVPPLQC